LHTLPTADSTALDALAKIRGAAAEPDSSGPDHDEELDAAKKEIAELRAVIVDLTVQSHRSGSGGA
jgi:hypothetical protein